MKILIIIAGFLLSLGSSGWFIRTYYGRDVEYRQALEAERSLSEEKAELAKKLAKDLKTIEQSNSLESIRTRMEYLRQQLSRLFDLWHSMPQVPFSLISSGFSSRFNSSTISFRRP